MSFNTEDLGLDMLKLLPVCHSCRKKSDGAKNCAGTILCGTCYDSWRLEVVKMKSRGFTAGITAEAFAKEQREGKFRPCWEAQLEGEHACSES
jgi:hypothetical protein